MSTILSILFIVVNIIFIIGLVKPKIILRKPQKYSLLKILLYWIICIIILLISIRVTSDYENKSVIKEATSLIEKVEYTEAIKKLENINENSRYYNEANLLIQEADSLNDIVLQLEAEKNKLEKKVKLKEQLQLEIASIDKGVDFSLYNGSVEALQMEIDLFHQWTILYYKGKNSDDPEIQKLAQQLINRVSRIQSNEFPRLRKEYANTASKLMWENDMKVSSSGTGNKYITFTGVIFAANKNKQEFHNEMNDVLKKFRFNQARYKWFDQASEYSYWTVYKGSDSDLLF